MKITVRVTLEHISKGKACHAVQCPVALAMIDAGISVGFVGPMGWTLQGEPVNDYKVRRPFPQFVRDFIVTYDAVADKVAIQPFEFEVEL